MFDKSYMSKSSNTENVLLPFESGRVIFCEKTEYLWYTFDIMRFVMEKRSKMNASSKISIFLFPYFF